MAEWIAPPPHIRTSQDMAQANASVFLRPYFLLRAVLRAYNSIGNHRCSLQGTINRLSGRELHAMPYVATYYNHVLHLNLLPLATPQVYASPLAWFR